MSERSPRRKSRILPKPPLNLQKEKEESPDPGFKESLREDKASTQFRILVIVCLVMVTIGILGAYFSSNKPRRLLDGRKEYAKERALGGRKSTYQRLIRSTDVHLPSLPNTARSSIVSNSIQGFPESFPSELPLNPRNVRFGSMGRPPPKRRESLRRNSPPLHIPQPPPGIIPRRRKSSGLVDATHAYNFQQRRPHSLSVDMKEKEKESEESEGSILSGSPLSPPTWV